MYVRLLTGLYNQLTFLLKKNVIVKVIKFHKIFNSLNKGKSWIKTFLAESLLLHTASLSAFNLSFAKSLNFPLTNLYLNHIQINHNGLKPSTHIIVLICKLDSSLPPAEFFFTKENTSKYNFVFLISKVINLKIC